MTDVMPSVPEHVMDAARESYNLAMSLEPVNEQALQTALSAALLAYRDHLLHEVFQHLDAHASWGLKDIEEQPVIYGAAAYLQQALDAQEQPAPPYEPRSGDVVEIRLTGPVSVMDNQCPGCGYQEQGEFSVNCRGLEYFFDPAEVKSTGLDIRVLRRADG